MHVGGRQENGGRDAADWLEGEVQYFGEQLQNNQTTESCSTGTPLKDVLMIQDLANDSETYPDISSDFSANKAVL